MPKWLLTACAFLALAGWLAPATPVKAEDRTAEKILDELKTVPVPVFDAKNRGDQKAIQEYLASREKASARRAELALELYKTDPENPTLPKLMAERWQSLRFVKFGQGLNDLTAEIEKVRATAKSEALGTEAAYMLAIMEMQGRASDPKAAREKTDSFIKRAPKDDRGAMLLMQSAGRADDPKEQAALYKRIIESYSDSRYAKMAEGNLKKLESVGKPFDLEFSEAIKGTQVSMKDLRGKVVVIDFWATWCGPCVAEMPKMKDLYAKYHDKGVEFVGVSLDQPDGGLAKLKEFVAKNEIPWPQYYQGNGWESAFSMSWGINSIPCVFVIDQEGKLYSVNARGKLQDMIPELLEKAKPKAEGD